MRKLTAHQFAFAAIQPNGWILRWTINPSAKQVRDAVGHAYSSDGDTSQGWLAAKINDGLRVTKIRLEPCNR